VVLTEILFTLLGIVLGFNIRHEWRLRKENLVLEQVDARLRKELAIAKNLNDSLRLDIADLRRRLAECEKREASPRVSQA
jgi:hypothetical protein